MEVAAVSAAQGSDAHIYSKLETPEEAEGGRRPSGRSAWEHRATLPKPPCSPRTAAALLLAPLVFCAAWVFLSVSITAASERDFEGRMRETKAALQAWRLDQNARYIAQHCEVYGELVNDANLAGECAKRKAAYYHKGPVRDAYVAGEVAARRHGCGRLSGYRLDVCKEEFRVAAAAFAASGFLARLQVPLLLWLLVSSRRVLSAASIAAAFYAAWRWRAYMEARADPARAPRGGIEADAACLLGGEEARRRFDKYD